MIYCRTYFNVSDEKLSVPEIIYFASRSFTSMNCEDFINWTSEILLENNYYLTPKMLQKLLRMTG